MFAQAARPCPLPVAFALLSACAAAMIGPARAQDTPLKVTGRCERLVIGGQDITQNCREQLVRSVVRGRTSFDVSAWDGQFLSFSTEGSAGPSLPVSLVVPGRRDKEAIVRNPAPATGTCTLSAPEAGKTTVACEATAQGKSYAAVFITDSALPDGAGKP